MDLLVLDHVSKDYSNGVVVRAVRKVSLSVKKAEFVCLVGPSGSGKTTLLNLLSGIDRPTAGRVLFNNRDLDQMTESERSNLRLHRMGFIFQAYNLVPVLTAFENVELILILLGVKKRQRRDRILSVFRELGIADLADRFPREMSGGQQQRVAIARAIIHQPDLVLADEPTANLDTDNAMALINRMLAMQTEHGITFIVTTHDPRVMAKAPRVIRLVDGHVVPVENGNP